MKPKIALARENFSIIHILLLCFICKEIFYYFYFGWHTNAFMRHGIPTTDLAARESFGFFTDISDSEWMQKKIKANSRSIFFDPKSPNNNSDEYFYNTATWMLNNVEPIFTCPHVDRIGGLGDGAKWVCDPHRLVHIPNCLIYSVGCNGNYMFEDALSSVSHKNCEIHVFDPSTKYGREGDTEKKNITYHAWGLKSSYAESKLIDGAVFHTFAETQKMLGHEGRTIDVFKIDCEGCEWPSYKDWLNDDVDIRQILIEVHPLQSKRYGQKIGDFFQAFLNRGYVPFSKEGNTHPSASKMALYEYSFIKLHPNFLSQKHR